MEEKSKKWPQFVAAFSGRVITLKVQSTQDTYVRERIRSTASGVKYCLFPFYLQPLLEPLLWVLLWHGPHRPSRDWRAQAVSQIATSRTLTRRTPVGLGHSCHSGRWSQGRLWVTKRSIHIPGFVTEIFSKIKYVLYSWKCFFFYQVGDFRILSRRIAKDWKTIRITRT